MKIFLKKIYDAYLEDFFAIDTKWKVSISSSVPRCEFTCSNVLKKLPNTLLNSCGLVRFNTALSLQNLTFNIFVVVMKTSQYAIIPLKGEQPKRINWTKIKYALF